MDSYSITSTFHAKHCQSSTDDSSNIASTLTYSLTDIQNLITYICALIYVLIYVHSATSNIMDIASKVHERPWPTFSYDECIDDPDLQLEKCSIDYAMP